MERRFTAFAWPLGICIAVAAVIWIATLYAVAQLRQSTEQEGESLRQNLANSLAEREASSVRAIDISLREMREAWLRDPEGFDRTVARHEDLLRRERVIQTAVVDADGWLLYSRLPWPGRLNFADREYFQQHRSNPGSDRLVISEPVLGRVTHEWAIQFSRAILLDGRFAGIVVVAVPPPALEQVYREIDLGPRGIITLARRDGQILARSTDLPGSVRVSLSPLPVAAAGAGQFSSRGLVDGVARDMAYRVIDEYGLVIFVGQSQEAVLAPYWRQRDYLVAFAAGATILLLCVGLLLALRRRDQARYLEERERMMLELHDGCIQAVYAVGLSLQESRAVVREQPQRADAMIAQAEADLNLVIHELRAFIGAEKPTALSAEQLRTEIERALPQAGPTAFEVDLDREALEALAAEEASHVLRIVREAAANVARHANATHARVRLAREEGRFVLDIADNGAGISPGASRTGLGLAHIEARARKLRGTARIERAQDGGTRVSVRFPQKP